MSNEEWEAVAFREDRGEAEELESFFRESNVPVRQQPSRHPETERQGYDILVPPDYVLRAGEMLEEFAKPSADEADELPANMSVLSTVQQRYLAELIVETLKTAGIQAALKEANSASQLMGVSPTYILVPIEKMNDAQKLLENMETAEVEPSDWVAAWDTPTRPIAEMLVELLEQKGIPAMLSADSPLSGAYLSDGAGFSILVPRENVRQAQEFIMQINREKIR